MLDPLTGLDGDYKILGELHRTFGSVTYLARNLHLLRDVTVTVVPISAAGGRSTLTQLSTDTRLFIGLRNPNIIPVLEGRWLGRNAFAVVRARVRGSTLAELLGTVGAVPMLRVHSTLEQVYPTLLWARENKIGLRHVSPEWVVFQQGSGRALLALDVPASIEPPPTGSHTEGTEDVRMLGRLARVMLSGKSDAGELSTPLQELRSDLSPKVALAADALAAGEWGGEDDVIQFLNLLLQTAGGSSDPTSATPRGTTSIMSPSRATMSITAPPASIAPPLAHPHADAMEPPAPAPPTPPLPEPEPEPVMASMPEPEPAPDESEQPRLTFDPEEPPEEDLSDDDDKPISRHTAPRRIVSPESGVPRIIPPPPSIPAPQVKPGGTIERSAVRPPLSPFPPAAPASQAPPPASAARPPAPPAPPVPPTPVEEPPPPEAIEPPIPARTIERPGPKRTPVQSIDATPIRIVEQVAPPTIDKSLSLILEPASARLTSTQGPPPPPAAPPPAPPAPPARHSGGDLKITHIEEPNAAFPPPQPFAPPQRAREAADNPDDAESMPRTLERPAGMPPEKRPSGQVQQGADTGTGPSGRNSKQFEIPASWPLESTGTPPAQPPSDDAGPFIAKTTTDPRGRPPTPRGSRAMTSSDAVTPPPPPPPPAPTPPPPAAAPPPAARQTPPQPPPAPPRVTPPRPTPPRVTPPPSTPVRQSAAAPTSYDTPAEATEAPAAKPKRQRPPRKIHIPVREILTTIVVLGVIAGGAMGGRAFLQSRRDAADSARVKKERADSTELAEAAKLAPKTKGKKSTSDSTNIGADVPSVGPGGDVCGSRSLIDQRTCFTNATQRVDSAMTHVLTTLVATLRKQAHIGAADNDPPIVDRLKSEQRAWAADRDHACPAIGSVELSGRARAQCFADHAAKRAKDLQQQLDAIPPI